ncbi:MAG: 16S rRNA (cytidine(1402)-2'-O)-methyltransferase, partial [Hyphomicrobium sp.]
MKRHRPKHRTLASAAPAAITAKPLLSSDAAPGQPPPEQSSETPGHAAREVERQLSKPLASGLHLVATPIGNLADITLRALAVLARADVVLCEDTRHSRTLLGHFGIRVRAEPYHEHNADEMRPRVLRLLAEGKRIALVSDAGTPLVSDPGFKLVRDVLAAGYHIESVPGPCAAIAALGPSGLPTDAFHFAGFLPPRSAARGTRITALAAIPATLVFYEAPQRVAETLADLAAILGPRPAVVARELTKLHEETLRGVLPELAVLAASREIKGEVVLLVGPPLEIDVNDDVIRGKLAEARVTMSLRDASKSVADALGVSRSRVYD